jgi:carboxyl-terminal processing protease
VADLFIDDGLIVSIRPRGGPRQWAMFNGVSAGSRLDFPMACLVNGRTASGSEIVAASLQDHERARLFGERTVGKGSVQNIEDIVVIDPKTGQELRGEIKYTTATFGRPNGKNLDRDTAVDADEWGVKPDVVIALMAWERRALAEKWDRDRSVRRKDTRRIEDRQLDAALKYLRARIERGK